MTGRPGGRGSRDRLKERLEGGMIEEVQRLMAAGIHPDDLIYYGLEYKYVTSISAEQDEL
ncbi:MAG: hypothetical protein MZV63_69400 [Marinilabiliales bacterium]|nr:hypothetical protein [Marinilabiliales bacterium]